eukprot:TRINITY_DN6026_c0_g1_i2.p1 TRINITY_DN6026_c0_g1~~TRINITY_DN6026_c0_g1_i2.p1  ORF type:complete len:277 (-),score=34.34 TRINITY_DN6026_c0_g1_i2:59-889(-)
MFVGVAICCYVNATKQAVVGSAGCGKSAMLIKLIAGAFITHYDPTLEDSYRKTFTFNEETVVLDFTDTAGQKVYREFLGQNIKNAGAYLLMYDMTDEASVLKLEDFHQLILDQLERTVELIPIVLVALKADLADERKVSTAQGQALAKKLGVSYFEASAKTAINYHEMFETLAREVDRTNRLRISEAQLAISPGTIGSTYTGTVAHENASAETQTPFAHQQGQAIYSPSDNAVIASYQGGWSRGQKSGPGKAVLRSNGQTIKGIWGNGCLIRTITD